MALMQMYVEGVLQQESQGSDRRALRHLLLEGPRVPCLASTWMWISKPGG